MRRNKLLNRPDDSIRLVRARCSRLTARLVSAPATVVVGLLNPDIVR